MRVFVTRRELASFRYVVFKRTSVVRSPRVVMTTELPGVVELDHLLRRLRFDGLADLVEVLSVDADRRLKHHHLVRTPLLQGAHWHQVRIHLTQ